MAFTKLGLSDHLVRGIRAIGYTAPTEIQSLAIPAALAGKDVFGCAQTGTGKTAAFVLPILHRLSAGGGSRDQKGGAIRALIVTPTRELAAQADDFIKSYGRFLNIRSLTVYGGVPIEPQLKALRRGVDIVIATPGRLLDHVERRSVDLSHVEILVLDEADRMLDMGFINDIRRIVALVPRTRQTLLFAATMPDEIKKLAAGVQNHPAHVEVGKLQNPAAGVRQHVYRVQRDAKLDLLLHILGTNEMESVLVFSRTKHGADRIARRLERSGIASSALHSDRSQSQRQRALDGFKRGEFRVLIATDIASRGIDVEGISHVINFDTPAYAEDYIHRIGRTGRASATGDALTFVSGEEEDSLRRIEKFTGQSFKREPYPGFHAPAKTADSRAAQHPAQGGRNSRQISGPGQHDRAVHRSKLDRSFSVTERAGKARPAAGPKEELKVVHRDGAVRHRRRYFR